MLEVLVDFDNVDGTFKSAGLVGLCQRIVYRVGSSNLRSIQTVRIKLYGGWYTDKLPTKLAQELTAITQADFPLDLTVQDSQGTAKVKILCELAYSLEADPGRHLFHTFRPRGVPPNLKAEAPSTKGCSINPCPIDAVSRFLNARSCPQAGCAIKPEHLLFRGEQKLVDTMLTADIIHLSRIGRQVLAVATSDDDLWPGIRSAILNGTRIIHVHVKPGASTLSIYSYGMSQKYAQVTL